MEFKVKDGQIIYYRLVKGFQLFLHVVICQGSTLVKEILYRDYHLIFIDSRNHKAKISRQVLR